MCTVSWLAAPDGGYELFFNRDESYARGESALPPRPAVKDGVRFIAPIDAEAGGTWIAANELGLTVCLLNRYPAVPPRLPPAPTRRGHLVMGMADADSADDVFARLGRLELGVFRPFTLLVLDLEGPARRAWWDGRRLVVSPSPSPVPLASSSKRSVEAAEAREALWRTLVLDRGGPGRERQVAYHRSHQPEPGPLAPCVHRSDGGTVSFTCCTGIWT